MSYKLEKPYNDEARADFIALHNHKNGLCIEETEQALFALEVNEIMDGDEPVVNPNYDVEQKAREHARVQQLFMTRSDFFDGTIKAFGADETVLGEAIVGVVAPQCGEVELMVALNNFKNALHFYRFHPLFEMLSGCEIPVADGHKVVVSAVQWDKFFDETDKKNPDAYKALIEA